MKRFIRRKWGQLALALGTALIMVVFLTGARKTYPVTPLDPLTEKGWEEIVHGLELIARQDPDPKIRERTTYIAHLAREGWRLAEADALADCFGITDADREKLEAEEAADKKRHDSGAK